MQTERQALESEPLQSGAAESAGAAMPSDFTEAAWRSWHGAEAIVFCAGAATDDAAPCAMCTDAIAVVAPLRIKATLNSTRNRMAQADLPALYLRVGAQG